MSRDWRAPRCPATQAVVSCTACVRPDLFQCAGKYLGVLDRLPHLQALGATAVLLTPPLCSGEGPWGRAPRSFFAPEPAWATGSDPAAPMLELKELVKGLHAEGIEVIMQVRASLRLCCVHLQHATPDICTWHR